MNYRTMTFCDSGGVGQRCVGDSWLHCGGSQSVHNEILGPLFRWQGKVLLRSYRTTVWCFFFSMTCSAWARVSTFTAAGTASAGGVYNLACASEAHQLQVYLPCATGCVKGKFLFLAPCSPGSCPQGLVRVPSSTSGQSWVF